MTCFNPLELARWSNGNWKSDVLPQSLHGFCFDARQLKPRECFVALSGGARDGHDFSAQAASQGAAALIVEKAQCLEIPQLIVDDSLLAMGAIAAGIRKRFTAPVIGITGSCGKTSTKEMLRLLLGESRTHATAGNWNNRIGVPMTLFGLDAAAHDFAVIEAGINQPGEMAALGEMIAADLTIVTNIASAHLELLGSMDCIAREKAELVLRSRSDAPVVLPNSVFQYPVYADYADRALVIAHEGESVLCEPRRVIRYRVEVASVGHSTLHLRDGPTVERFQVASPSEGICVNAALAIVAARELGISDTLIRERIAVWVPSSTRGRIASVGQRLYYIDCYNANPASMSDAIAAFDRVTAGEQSRCYVLGAMNELGAESVAMHVNIGKALRLRATDRVLFVGPEMLTRAYYDGALQAGANPAQLEQVSDVGEIKSDVADFDGALFLKGSRSYALEKLLPVELL